MKSPKCKRFLNDHKEKYAFFIKNAKEYIGKLNQKDRHYQFLKPYDLNPYNKWYYIHMYEILNLLQAMRIKPFGRVLEVGSGPGFVTEILMALGYTVDAVEPSKEFINIAQKRVVSYAEHYHIKNPPEINFHCTTLEEIDLAGDTFDAAIFYASLHHIIDEETALRNTYRMLRPGGCLGISEGAWIPGNRDIEEPLEKEMQKYSTLENPFTIEYLDYLLKNIGFVQLVRYHQINGLFPIIKENLTIWEAAQQRAETSNILTAIKTPNAITTEKLDAETLAKIKLLDKKLEENHVKLKVKLYNCGKSTWLNSAEGVIGSVSLALFGRNNKGDFQEAEPRAHIDRHVQPGEEIELTVIYHLPEDYKNFTWFLDLVNEHMFWFSERGTHPCKVI